MKRARALALLVLLASATTNATADACREAPRDGDALPRRFFAAWCIAADDPGRDEKLNLAFRDPHPFVRRAGAARALVIAPHRLDRFLESDDPYLHWFAASRDHSRDGIAHIVALVGSTLRRWQREQRTPKLLYYPSFVPAPTLTPDALPPGTQATESLRLEALVDHELRWLARYGGEAALPAWVAVALAGPPFAARVWPHLVRPLERTAPQK